MDRDDNDRSLDDTDGPIASFQGATLRIHQDRNNPRDDVPTLPVSQPSGHLASGDSCLWPISKSKGVERKTVSPTEVVVDGSSKTDVAAIPWSDDFVKNLFSSREGLVDQAVADSVATFVEPNVDGDVIGSWILTEISIWDAEKERLILLTTNSLLVIKFDFIALKPLEVRRTPLEKVDTIVQGDLVYPPASLVPARNSQGLRIMWNKGEPIAFSKKWNPFSNDIPFLTFTSHPLLCHKGLPRAEDESCFPRTQTSCDVEVLSRKLHSAMVKLGKDANNLLQHKPILLHNYLSIGSLIHNRNSLGFFKVRGRFSF